MLQATPKSSSKLSQSYDRLGRPLNDLRLSVIDRCNFRCSYCMPATSLKGKDPFLSRQDRLSDEELIRIVNAFTGAGVSRLRLTGGEPLLRPGFIELVGRMAQIPAIEDLSMTSNGVLLPRMAKALKQAGLNRITVSLDSLDEQVFSQMSGGHGSAAEVLTGITAAEAAGFPGLKINCVVQKGVNDHTVMDLVEHFRGSGHIVRLIEFLDVGSSNRWHRDQVVPGHEWRKRIHDRWPLWPLDKLRAGETAERYAYEDGRGEIGLINSISQPFCGACSRARITADGTLYTCLFSPEGTPLKPLLRGKNTDSILESFIRETWTGRDDRYSETRQFQTRSGNGQEMFRMGG